SSGKVPL
nr:Chain B, SSGKVPL [synthetic construct]